MIDEQRFQARLAALDAAARWSNSTSDVVLRVAERFEGWLLQPVPADEHAPTGYDRCTVRWRSSGAGHHCADPLGHTGAEHLCSCGARFTEGQDGMPSTLQPARQPCGAFLRPDWYTGDSWNVCSGEHVGIDDAGATPLTVGWHWTGPPLRGGIFATHHMVTLRDVPTGRCACGAPWPCPGGEVDSKT